MAHLGLSTHDVYLFILIFPKGTFYSDTCSLKTNEDTDNIKEMTLGFYCEDRARTTTCFYSSPSVGNKTREEGNVLDLSVSNVSGGALRDVQ